MTRTLFILFAIVAGAAQPLAVQPLRKMHTRLEELWGSR
jgi:hypothetical protein